MALSHYSYERAISHKAYLCDQGQAGEAEADSVQSTALASSARESVIHDQDVLQTNTPQVQYSNSDPSCLRTAESGIVPPGMLTPVIQQPQWRQQNPVDKSPQ